MNPRKSQHIVHFVGDPTSSGRAYGGRRTTAGRLSRVSPVTAAISGELERMAQVPGEPRSTIVPDRARDSVALRAVFRIAEKWGLSVEKAARLLGTPQRTVYRWRDQVANGGEFKDNLPVDTIERMSYLLGIWKASMILLPDEPAAVRFLLAPNTAPLFGGRAPLEKMLDGKVLDLAMVRSWFDGWRG